MAKCYQIIKQAQVGSKNESIAMELNVPYWCHWQTWDSKKVDIRYAPKLSESKFTSHISQKNVKDQKKKCNLMIQNI